MTARTAKDLAARGYRLIGQARMFDYENRSYRPPAYALVRVGPGPHREWFGLVVGGVPSARGLYRARRSGRQTAQTYTALRRLKGRPGICRGRPVGTGFATTVEAAHAIVDYIEASS